MSVCGGWMDGHMWLGGWTLVVGWVDTCGWMEMSAWVGGVVGGCLMDDVHTGQYFGG